MIRTLVVDDSAVSRQSIKNILESDPELKVVGFAKNGLEAIQQAGKVKPDVITMDIYMPKLDGFEATKEIMRLSPTPIVVVSASVDTDEMKISFKAIQAGALALVEKPGSINSLNYQAIKENLVTTVKIMSAVKVIRRWQSGNRIEKLILPKEINQTQRAKIVAIGSSTGGPAALSVILKQLPKNFQIPVVIVQHITAGFGRAFADWLSGECHQNIRIASHCEKIKPGDIIIAPDDTHLGVDESGRVFLSNEVSFNHHRPSVNYLFNTVAKVYGPKAIGVILTGMGDDGVAGIKMIKASGGHTIAQDEASSVVYGMPKAAIEAGAIDKIVPVDKIMKTILGFI